MGEGILDDRSVDIPCPKCGHNMSMTIGALRVDPRFNCAACGQAIRIEASELREALGEVAAGVAALEESIRDLNES